MDVINKLVDMYVLFNYVFNTVSGTIVRLLTKDINADRRQTFP